MPARLQLETRCYDAKTLGKRAACLAHSLEDTATVDKILMDLTRFYGRKGFVAPPKAALPQLCGGLAPIRK